MLPGKDMKMIIYSKAELYSSDGYVAEQRYIHQDMFVKRYNAKHVIGCPFSVHPFDVSRTEGEIVDLLNDKATIKATTVSVPKIRTV